MKYTTLCFVGVRLLCLKEDYSQCISAFHGVKNLYSKITQQLQLKKALWYIYTKKQPLYKLTELLNKGPKTTSQKKRNIQFHMTYYMFPFSIPSLPTIVLGNEINQVTQI